MAIKARKIWDIKILQDPPCLFFTKNNSVNTFNIYSQQPYEILLCTQISLKNV